jgi:fructokinase
MSEKHPVLFGEVLFDCFEDGSRILGGAPFNVAWHLQAFGCDPLLISRVGNDPMGRQIRETMQHWGMNTSGLQQDSQHATGEVRVTLDNGQPDFEIVQQRAWDFIHWDCFPPLQANIIYHGSLGMRDRTARDSFNRLIDEQRAPLFLDVNLRAPFWQQEQVTELIERVHWLKINDHELTTLVSEGDNLEQKAASLFEKGPLQLVIVTLGDKGAFSLDAQGHIERVAPEGLADVVDTVGAGDAFAAVYLLGLIRQWPVDLMLNRAQQFASQVVQQRGATALDHGLYQPFIAQWRL